MIYAIGRFPPFFVAGLGDIPRSILKPIQKKDRVMDLKGCMEIFILKCQHLMFFVNLDLILPTFRGFLKTFVSVFDKFKSATYTDKSFKK